MDLPTRIVQFSLLLTTGLAFYLTWYLVLNNGTAPPPPKGVPTLPGTSIPLKTSYTGIEAIDDQLAVLVTFFWPIVDGNTPALSLFCIQFEGGFVAVWSMFMIEGMRAGNKGRLISYPAVWGAIFQNITYAVTIPVYLALYISTSPLLSPTSTDLLPTSADVAGLPLCMVLGFIGPSVLFSLPAPSVVSFDQKQVLMSIWQAFPLWVSLANQVFKRTMPLLFPGFSTSTKANNTMAIRIVYIFGLIAAGIVRVSVLTLSFTSILLPSLYAPEFAAAFAPSKVFLPTAITPATKMPSIGAGILLLFQYDQLVGSTAVLAWANLLYVKAREKALSPADWAKLFVGNATLATLAGPEACAVALIWARDEMILSRTGGRGKKNV